ncbi:MAG: hypothetical protein HY508_08265, partial [Acidobacteria bacterium]|nr:hypothetical protein [Acidobacteriota bacterium]
MRDIRAFVLAVTTLGIFFLGTSRLRAQGATSPGAEEEITRKLQDLQTQIDTLKAELAEAKKKGSETTTPAAEAPAAAAASTPAAAPAPAPPEEKKTTLQAILGATTVSGFVDGYYGYNFNHPQNR